MNRAWQFAALDNIPPSLSVGSFVRGNLFDASFDFVKEIHGDTIADVLSYLEYSPEKITRRLRNTAEQAVREGRITARERQQIIHTFNASMQGYTYYEKED